jgi:DNA-binding CsgD family transcriptional regulator
MGRTASALEAVGTAERAAAAATQPQAVTRSRCHSAVVRLMALKEINVGEIDALVAGGAERLQDGDALVLLSYLLPYMFARGERELAHPRLRAFRLAAEAAGHEWRLGDAAAFEAAEKSVSEPLTTIPLETINTWNWLGRWRVQLGRFRAAHLRRDLRSCQEETTALLRARRRAGKADFDSIGAVEGYHEAFLGGGAAPVQLNPPEEAHLLNLPSILVGAEAVSLAGTQAMAMRWLAWLGAKLPDQFQTSLEWPVARARVEALLLLRSGDLRGAKSRFEKAIAWAAQAGYPSEQALAQVQLAELLFHGSFSATVRAWRPFRAEGWETLQAMGVDPAPFAYDVARLVGLASDRSLSPGLTRREAEVLALLAEGLTYKAIAERLGVRWPTVQSLAHRCYDKLDVAGRWPAVEVGRELGII